MRSGYVKKYGVVLPHTFVSKQLTYFEWQPFIFVAMVVIS